MAVIAQVIITIQGYAQDVGYRVACIQRVRLLGLCGWTHDRYDGAVEVFLAGPEASVLSTWGWVWEGPDSTQVT